MRKIALLLGIVLAGLAWQGSGEAASVVAPCVTNGTACPPVTAINPLPVTAAPSTALSASIPGASSTGLSAITIPGAAGGTSAARSFYGAYVTASSTPLWLFVVNSNSISNSNGTFVSGTASGQLEDCIGPFTNQSGSITYQPVPRQYSAGVTIYASSTACPALTSSITDTALSGIAQ